MHEDRLFLLLLLHDIELHCSAVLIMCVWEWRLDGHLTRLSDVRFLKSMLIIFINIIKEMMLLISVLLALYVVFRGLFLIYITLKDK